MVCINMLFKMETFSNVYFIISVAKKGCITTCISSFLYLINENIFKKQIMIDLITKIGILDETSSLS